MNSRTLATLLACATLACSVKTEQSADTSAGGDSVVTTTRADSAAVVPSGATNHTDTSIGATRLSQAPPSGPDAGRPSAGKIFTITPDGFGQLRVGMTVAQAAKAIGRAFAAPRHYAGGCAYAVLPNAPPGFAVMLDKNRIARFEVRIGGIATAEGARIGDTEARIDSLYAGKVATTPHKYLPGGHYLTVTPSAGSNNRIVFETDGSRVTEYRSGRTPEVEQIERCG